MREIKFCIEYKDIDGEIRYFRTKANNIKEAENEFKKEHKGTILVIFEDKPFRD